MGAVNDRGSVLGGGATYEVISFLTLGGVTRGRLSRFASRRGGGGGHIGEARGGLSGRPNAKRLLAWEPFGHRFTSCNICVFGRQVNSVTQDSIKGSLFPLIDKGTE